MLMESEGEYTKEGWVHFMKVYDGERINIYYDGINVELIRQRREMCLWHKGRRDAPCICALPPVWYEMIKESTDADT